MFRQMDEAFNRMMKNFGAFDGHVPDQEQGINSSVLSLQHLSVGLPLLVCLLVSRITHNVMGAFS